MRKTANYDGMFSHFHNSSFSFQAKISVILCVFYSTGAYSGLYFAPELIADNPDMVADLSRFEKAGVQLPGNYQVDIFLNGREMMNRELRFISAEDTKAKQLSSEEAKMTVRDETGLIACLNRQILDELGVNLRLLSDTQDTQCLSPGVFIPEAFTRFDFEHMRLDVSIPQAAMKSSARGYIPPDRWDEGINAARLNYVFNGNNVRGNNGNRSSHYLGLNSGLNLGPWRLRDERTWNENSGSSYRYRQWQHHRTFIGRAIIPLRSEFTAGDSMTKGELFDSVGYRGIQISTDDHMYPDSQRSFAPVIRGTALTNARVNVRQNGYTVYQTYVAPGAFEINDLFAMGSSGDLEVTVTEADGTERISIVPYSTLPLLQREGRVKYSLTAGTFRSSGKNYEEPKFAEGTLIWGLPFGLTSYGGTQYSENYFSGLLGAGMNLGSLGAFSADVSHADSTLTDGSRHKGQSLRFLYARTLNNLGTTFQLTGYRYSTSGYRTLNESALKRMSGWLHQSDETGIDGRPLKNGQSGYYDLNDRRRAKIQASVSQRVGDTSSFYFSGNRETYWNIPGATDSLQAGFTSSVGIVNYSITLSRYSGRATSENSAFLTLSAPLSSLFPGSKKNLYATYSAGRNGNGDISHQAGLSGTLLDGDNLNWNVSQAYKPAEGNSGNAGASYRGTYGSTSLGYSYSQNYQQVNYGMSGGALLHDEGLTIGQQMGDTSILVAAPGIASVALENESGVHTDWRGYAIKPYASVYRENRVALDSTSLDDMTDIDNAVTHVVPTRGAVVKTYFKGHYGNRVLMTLTHKGKPLPFGSVVTFDERSGIVGDDGQVYLSGLQETGSVYAEWGDSKHCSAQYRLPPVHDKNPIIRINSNCI